MISIVFSTFFKLLGSLPGATGGDGKSGTTHSKGYKLPYSAYSASKLQPVQPLQPGFHSNEGKSYGDKIFMVKVPSKNKAALLDKWAPSALASPHAVTSNPTPNNERLSSDGAASSLSGTAPAGNKNPNLEDSLRENQRVKTTKVQSSLPGEINKSHSIDQKPDSLLMPKADFPNDFKQEPQSYSTKNATSQNLKGEYGQRYLERVTGSAVQTRNETLGPEVCMRAGLFRHPLNCQHFYECYWDRWINRYTIHIFKCPVHLVYDDYITACNWPFDGPACIPHEAIKLYKDPSRII